MAAPTPISVFVQVAGEPATIITPATDVPYSPSSTETYVPGEDASTPVRGITALKQMEEGMPSGCTGAFTIEAYARPEHLQTMKSRLLWRGKSQVIHSLRERWWASELDGYTLFLTK